MGCPDTKRSGRQEISLAMELLDNKFADRFELYQVMVEVFFRRLNHDEKIDAMNEVIEEVWGIYNGDDH